MTKPNIVDIPAKMERFYGKGKMLHPTMEIIEALIGQIPFGTVTTIEHLCNKLAAEFQTQVTCPMRTGNFLKKIAVGEEASTAAPYWRVLRKNGWLINGESIADSAAKLEAEGFEIIYSKSNEIQVVAYKDKLFDFKTGSIE